MSTTLRMIRKAGAAAGIIVGTLFVAAPLSVAAIWWQFSRHTGGLHVDAGRGLIRKHWLSMERDAWLLALRWWLVASVVVCLLVLISHKVAKWPSWRLALLWVPPFVVAVAIAATLPNGFEPARYAHPGAAGPPSPGSTEYTGLGGFILWPYLTLGLQIVVTAVVLSRSIPRRPTSARWGVAQRVGIFTLVAVSARMIVLNHHRPARGYAYTGNPLYLVVPLLALGLQIAVAALAVRGSIRQPSTTGRWDIAQRQGVLSIIAVGALLMTYGSIVHSYNDP